MEKLLESLYVINKKAKHYEINNSKQIKEIENVRRNCLYNIKHKILKNIMDKCQNKKIHIMEDDKYLFLEFQKYKFHIPLEKIQLDEREEIETTVIKNYKKKDKVKIDQSLKKSLKYINKKHNYNANNYLNPEYIMKNNRKRFCGWLYLK
jgi:hypothetical protein